MRNLSWRLLSFCKFSILITLYRQSWHWRLFAVKFTWERLIRNENIFISLYFGHSIYENSYYKYILTKVLVKINVNVIPIGSESLCIQQPVGLCMYILYIFSFAERNLSICSILVFNVPQLCYGYPEMRLWNSPWNYTTHKFIAR